MPSSRASRRTNHPDPVVLWVENRLRALAFYTDVALVSDAQKFLASANGVGRSATLTGMNYVARPVLATATAIALLGVLALAGCASTAPTPAAQNSANLTDEPSPECSNKACGVDCTAAGSDEPFNCNADGRCVATGQELSCEAKTCPEILPVCEAGTRPADTDGDGCVDGCAPYVSGHVLFPQGWAPPGGRPQPVVVKLLDVTRADAPSVTVAQSSFTATGEASREFLLQVTGAIAANRSYVVSVHVDSDGDARVSKGDLITMESYPVLTGGHGNTVDVRLLPVK